MELQGFLVGVINIDCIERSRDVESTWFIYLVGSLSQRSLQSDVDDDQDETL